MYVQISVMNPKKVPTINSLNCPQIWDLLLLRSLPDGKGVREDVGREDSSGKPGNMAEWMRTEAVRHMGGLVLHAEGHGFDPTGTRELIT